MSDTLPEREWCDDCHGYTHMPYCPSYEPPETEANQLCPDGIGLISAGNEHQVTKSGACAIAGCPCRGWSAQETAGVKEVSDQLPTPAPDISSLLDQLGAQLGEVVRERDELRKALRQVRVMFFEYAQAGGYVEKGRLIHVDNEQHPWIPGAEAPRAIAIIDAALNNHKGPSE